MSERTVQLDVRRDIQVGREPFSKIMTAVAGLEKNQELLLIVPFEPTSLFPVLEKRGFLHQTTHRQDGDWEVLFTRERKRNGRPLRKTFQSRLLKEPCACGCGRKVLEVDVRGLEPPESLLRIVERLKQLKPDIELKALTDSRPISLYAHLDERGYVGHTEQQPEGGFVTYIHLCQ